MTDLTEGSLTPIIEQWYHSEMETRMRRLAKRPGADQSGSIAVLATCATILIGSLAGVSPEALQGQDTGAPAQAPPTASVDDELLEVAARLHVQVTVLQQALAEELARYHDTVAQTAARERFSTRMEEVLEAHRMTAAQYERILFVIATDEERRTRFDEMLDAIKSREDGAGDA